MLRQTGAGPEHASPFDADWLDQTAGRSLASRTRLIEDPVGACDEAVERAACDEAVERAAGDWDSALSADRPRLKHALGAFLHSSDPLFVLIGRSGAGKSWSLTDWVVRQLSGQIRILVRGTDARRLHSLGTLVAPQLRDFGPPDWRDEQFVLHLAAASRVAGRGALVVVIDDLALDPAPADDRALAGRVVVVEPEGDERIVSVALDGGGNGAAPGGDAPVWKIRAPKHGLAARLAPGNRVGLAIRPRGLRLFDAATEERIV